VTCDPGPRSLLRDGIIKGNHRRRCREALAQDTSGNNRTSWVRPPLESGRPRGEAGENPALTRNGHLRISMPSWHRRRPPAALAKRSPTPRPKRPFLKAGSLRTRFKNQALGREPANTLATGVGWIEAPRLRAALPVQTQTRCPGPGRGFALRIGLKIGSRRSGGRGHEGR
jgi:hypothetical protein